MNALTAVDTGSVRPHVLLYPLVAWVVMAVLAVLNGGLRETLLIPRWASTPVTC
jgi:hypothetical protein